MSGPVVTTGLRSVLDLFSIGIGPSSSHTVGPMRAATAFARPLRGLQVTRLEIELLGSLGSTGIGHGTPDAVVAGLRGLDPATCDPGEVHGAWSALGSGSPIGLAFGTVVRLRANDIRLCPGVRMPGHPNALRMRAWLDGVCEPIERVYYSIGGGAIIEEGAQHMTIRDIPVPHPYSSAAELLELCAAQQCDIAEIVRRNEIAQHGAALDRGLTERWTAMRDCLTAGLSGHGILPGGLGTPRRAGALADTLRNDGIAPGAPEWLQAYAIAVNEENAAGHRVVTAPTNGAAGIIPAVLYHHLTACGGDTAATVRPFLLTAAAVGQLMARNASISGADIGCQGEVGSAAAMAAAGYCAVLGGSPAVVENAAEIALEHHLGLTCDPVAGLVQIPCIERNAIAAGTAVAAARLALRGTGTHRVPLDVVIETVRQTGRDMSHRYKETSDGGLAVTVPYC
ncbi:L-serine ammonia-lyase [Nocardia sp. CA2R105]|uniref:L-serine ammonia-lyase n=1 Tax=Nocardia coffeae TaxID=2873381 RepID=UPI001CA66A9F|nr:L-serine ammonia-lyase [Nocardia coffeae]MBY8861291.1 L-serine ammonia-lyase [Nocardia coffeae]